MLIHVSVNVVFRWTIWSDCLLAVEHLISEASPRELLRLRKDDLVQLYIAAGLSDDAECLTKPEIIAAIVAARDDIAELPPSSPPARGDENSSEYSSDDGNIAGDEETDIPKHPALNGLKRRATINDLGRANGRPNKGSRSLSLSHLNSDAHSFESKKATRLSATTNTTESTPIPRCVALYLHPLPVLTVAVDEERLRVRLSHLLQPL